jgi:hypothetical protein
MDELLKLLESEIYRTAGTEFNIYNAVSVRKLKQGLTMFEGIRLQHLVKAFRELSQIQIYTPLRNKDKGENNGNEK